MEIHTELSNKNVQIIEKTLRYTFNNKSYIKKAFMHSSMANELGVESNERLEFFGDAILEMIVSEYLVSHTKRLEGDLSVIRSSLVSAKSLSGVVNSLNIAQFLIVNKSFSGAKRLSNNIKCDLYESILAAIYLDGGFEKAKEFVTRTLKLTNLNLEFYHAKNKDYKTPLQELLQQNGNIEIEYKLIKQEGPAHNPTFTMTLLIENTPRAIASASSKKEAEQLCAQKIYDSILSMQENNNSLSIEKLVNMIEIPIN